MVGDAARRPGWILAVVFLCLASGYAQLEPINNLKMNMGGSLGFGYGGGFGASAVSAHSTSFSGSGGLSGYYFHPNFVSFNLRPYYNRSQSNSTSQSIFNESGLNASSSFFGGSRFPGTIGFSKSFNSSGEFGIPGLGGLTTQGSAQGFNIGWSALVPGLPTLNANFSDSGSHSSVLGATGDFVTSSRNFSLNSNYKLDGFQLGTYYNHQNMGLTFPEFLNAQAVRSDSSSSGYGVTAEHPLPLSGSFSASWSRSDYGTADGVHASGTTDNATTLVSFTPINKLTLMGDFRYTSNLFGALARSVSGDGALPALRVDNSSRSIAFGSSAYYRVGHGFGLSGNITHREQFYQGNHFADTRYGGLVSYNYARPLFGMIHFSFGMVDTANELGNTGLNFYGNVGITRRFGRWETSADFSYAQGVQTLLALYTTSNYSYGGIIRRKLNQDTYWNATYRVARSALTHQEGTSNHSQSVSTNLSWRRYSFGASYGEGVGQTLLTPSGVLTPTPLAAVISPDDLLLFNASSWGISLGMSPVRRLTVTGSFSSAYSDTLAHSRLSINQGERYNLRTDYRLRKLVFSGAFSRVWQGISATGAPPVVLNSYYFGVSRWFDIF
jgi:hypothetical protein